MWLLDFRTRDVGGPVASVPSLYHNDTFLGHGLAALPSAPSGVTFVAHGFNNNRADGVRKVEGFARAAAAEVPALNNTLFVGILWPGDAIVGFLSYPTEERDADETARAFARVLQDFVPTRPPQFVAHSLGCRMVLETLDILSRSVPTRAWMDQIVLMAAAVDNDSLGRKDRYRPAVERASRLVNLASTEDRILRFAFPLGDWAAGIFSWGYTRSALGRRGPSPEPAPPQHVRPIQLPEAAGIDHGDYLEGVSTRQVRIARLSGRALNRDEPLDF